MAKLTSGRRFGGIFLILIGFLFFFMGFAILFFGSAPIIDIASILVTNLSTAIFLVGLFHIFFGVLLIWAGRMIRNENFFPDYLRGLMK